MPDQDARTHFLEVKSSRGERGLYVVACTGQIRTFASRLETIAGGKRRAAQIRPTEVERLRPVRNEIDVGEVRTAQIRYPPRVATAKLVPLRRQWTTKKCERVFSVHRRFPIEA